MLHSLEETKNALYNEVIFESIPYSYEDWNLKFLVYYSNSLSSDQIWCLIFESNFTHQYK